MKKKVIQFTKMQGLGNDFMVIDATREPIDLTSEQIRHLGDRHLGVGFDQLLIVAPSTTVAADFTYLIYNADGTEAKQCGNGARCLLRFIVDQRLSQKAELKLDTHGHLTTIALAADGQVKVGMGVPSFRPESVPFMATNARPLFQLPYQNQVISFSVVSLGNPHAVIQVDDIERAPVADVGAYLMTHPSFPEGVNVGFAQVINRKQVKLRVYERGAAETLACGSGACAAMAVLRQQNAVDESAIIEQTGGNLAITWADENSELWMTGPAVRVYDGKITI